MFKTKNYCITPKNVLCHELIGLKAEVVKSTDKSRIGLKGKIIDETRNTLQLETKSGEKTLPKKEVWLEVNLKNEKAMIAGKDIVVKPEARTKFCWRKCHGS
jgi:ribonuclease P protein subunit POP4